MGYATMKPQTPLASLLWEADLCDSISADLQQRTWTFKVPYSGAKSGKFVIVPAHEVREAIQQEQELVILQPAEELEWRGYYAGNYGVLEGAADDGSCSVRLQCEMTPSADGQARGDWRPGIWYGQEERTDSAGRTWKRRLGDHVMDDFGFLVEVPR